MSYGTTNYLPPPTSLGKVLTIVELLGYSKISRSRTSAEYFWYDEKDYHSYTGVPLWVRAAGNRLIVETSTPAARSYFDLAHQNRTVRELKRLLGGSFSTDEGRGVMLIRRGRRRHRHKQVATSPSSVLGKI